MVLLDCSRWSDVDLEKSPPNPVQWTEKSTSLVVSLKQTHLSM